MSPRASFFALLVPCLVTVCAAAACGDESGGGGDGGGGGDDTKTTSEATTTDATTDASSSDASSSSGGVDPCEGLAPVSFTNDVAPIFVQRCATTGCHVGTLADGGLDLSDGNAHGDAVNVATKSCGGDRTRVIPSDPSESYLHDKIHGVDLCGTSKKMPPSGKPQLTDEQKQVITAWICGGALDD